MERQPVGRFGDPEELANLASYLLSDYASYITGEVNDLLLSLFLFINILLIEFYSKFNGSNSNSHSNALRLLLSLCLTEVLLYTPKRSLNFEIV